VSQLFSGWLSLGGSAGSGVAWWAHVGGFLFGIVATFFFARRRVYPY
jgi:membrane associated rhomboid family serine protease